MCGIAGGVFWAGRPGDRDPRAVVHAMTDALAHRGPDGWGVVDCGKPGPEGRQPVAVLGHRRLAIIDLTDRAAQPMVSQGLPLWITFNGEIYNFKALRAQLEGLGRRFHSDSDTEVILQGYEQWGDGVVDRLRGMFAFALWDGRDHSLLLARDRLGIKPLYLYRAEGVLLFASEVGALLASGLVPRKLDRVALDQYLAAQAVAPPRTLVEGIEMMRAGHIVRVTAANRVSDRQDRDMLEASDWTDGTWPTDREARDQVRHLLEESVALHLLSDVPVGVFLSGGIDSSAIVGLIRRAGVTPRTFAVTFPGTAFDEAAFARAAAEAFKADHTEVALTEADVIEGLPNALSEVDHPSGDGLNTFIVSRAVRQAGIKVALSGLGGDELFGGYPSFTRMRRLARWEPALRHSPAMLRQLAGAVVRTVGRDSVRSGKVAALVETDGTLPQAFPILRQLFSTRQRQALLDPSVIGATEGADDPYVTLLSEAVAKRGQTELMALVSYAEARTYMHDVLLRDTDQMSMRHGLEVRVPLLDHRLVEYVISLPDSVKRSGGTAKAFLLESLELSLPDVCVRRPKQGFVLPFDDWMRGPLKPYCEDRLGSGALLGRGLFQERGLKQLWQSFLLRDGETSWSRVWALIALEAWMARSRMNA